LRLHRGGFPRRHHIIRMHRSCSSSSNPLSPLQAHLIDMTRA
jgi:hypothetical protein